jgi:hypothetical protein
MGKGVTRVVTNGVVVLGWGATSTEQRDAWAMGATQNHSESAESAPHFISVFPGPGSSRRNAHIRTAEDFASSFPRIALPPGCSADLRLRCDESPVTTEDGEGARLSQQAQVA